MVVKASAHKHVSREDIDDRQVANALVSAERSGNTHRFIIQITTKGGALAVVQRGIDNVLAGMARYPAFGSAISVEIVTEDLDEIAVLNTLYSSAPIPVTPYLLPNDYRTPRVTRASRLAR
ncbi:hypothetical protein [Microbacterium alcoholitolerans]|uniref:hypothetical protein n=1 Tax=unclassified Microbacterium TaxID=2609290 RepID=UPI003D1695FE